MSGSSWLLLRLRLAAAGWRSRSPWPPSSRSSVPRAMKDKSHIPAATFAIAGPSHMAMRGFLG